MICPSPNAPPSLRSSVIATLLQPQERLFEGLLALCLLLSIVALRDTWHAPGQRRAQAVRVGILAVFFAGLIGGFFLLVEVADPWGYMLLLWYEQAKEALQSHQCSITALGNTYENLHHIEQILNGIGVASIIESGIICKLGDGC